MHVGVSVEQNYPGPVERDSPVQDNLERAIRLINERMNEEAGSCVIAVMI